MLSSQHCLHAQYIEHSYETYQAIKGINSSTHSSIECSLGYTHSCGLVSVQPHGSWHCESPLFYLASKIMTTACKGNACFKNNNYNDLLICPINVCLVVYNIYGLSVTLYGSIVTVLHYYTHIIVWRIHLRCRPTCFYANINVQQNCYKFRTGVDSEIKSGILGGYSDDPCQLSPQSFNYNQINTQILECHYMTLFLLSKWCWYSWKSVALDKQYTFTMAILNMFDVQWDFSQASSRATDMDRYTLEY